MIEHLLNAMIRNGIIQESDADLYRFGLLEAVIKILHLATALAIGALCGLFWETVVFTVDFAVVREYAGGFHASSRMRCYILTWVQVIAALAAIKFYPAGNLFALWIPTFVAAGIIFLLAPVENDSKPLDDLEVTHYRRRTRLFLVIEIVLCALFMALGLASFAMAVAMGFVLLSVSLIAGIIKNRKRETQT